MDEDHSDKENLAPPGVDVHHPPQPINSKGNILKKHVAVETYYEQHPKPPTHAARKRQRLGTLTDSPPRPSYASQMAGIFAPRPAPQKMGSKVVSVPGIPKDAMSVYKHFRQALRCAPGQDEVLSPGNYQDKGQASSDTESSASGVHSSADETAEDKCMRIRSGMSTVPLLHEEASSEGNTSNDQDHLWDIGAAVSHLPSTNDRNGSRGRPSVPRSSSPSPSPNEKRDSILSPQDETQQHPPSPFNQPLSVRIKSTTPLASPQPLRSKRNVFDVNDDNHTTADRSPSPFNIDPTIGRPTSPGDEEHLVPNHDLERAITGSFPPTPSRQERRKTLNIDLRNTPPHPNVSLRPKKTPREASTSSHGPQPAPATTDCNDSTDSWTGDEIFFPPRQHPVAVESPALPTTPTACSRRPAVPLLSPLRAIRPNRFHVPPVRSPMGQGVPLCMEDHPASVGSDADDEDEGSGMSE